jgi:hypothetical protein
MSKLGLVIILILTAGRNYAQEYFVLIQADSSQSFYIRLGDQLYPSSPEGHLILSRLKDSSYSITIGFPGQIFPEERFFFDIHQKDQVFRLKHENRQIWRLYDGEGAALRLDAGDGAFNKSRITGIKKDDAFSRLMADVVKDTAVMYNTYAMQQILSDSPARVATAGSPAAGSPAAGPPAAKSATPASPTAASPTAGLPTTGSLAAGSPTAGSATSGSPTAASPDTTALAHLTGDTSLFRPYSVKDTSVAMEHSVMMGHSVAAVPAGRDSLVSTVVPADTQPVAAMPGPVRRDSSAAAVVPLYRPMMSDSAVAAGPLYRPSDVVKVSEHKSARSLRLVYTDHAVDSKTDTIVVIIPVDTGRQAAEGGHGPNPDSPVLGSGSRPVDSLQKRAPAKPALPFVNSDCHAYATDYDVDKLRVKMLGSGKDEDRIQDARKFFKTKCFSTRQIRALSEVFATDATKFRFLEAAYPFVSDDHFPELISLFADPVYSGRFKAMTGRQ